MTKTLTYANADSRTVAAVIHSTPIRQDAEGRYCLNDLHQAAGGENRHQPAFFFKRPEIVELMAEINSSPQKIKPVETSRGRYGGTYVVDDLALTYAMWVRPAFHPACCTPAPRLNAGGGNTTRSDRRRRWAG